MSTLIELQIRQATAAEFASENPVLLAGEPTYETDTGLQKMGDGTTAYNDLAYTSIQSGTSLPGTGNEGDIFLLHS